MVSVILQNFDTEEEMEECAELLKKGYKNIEILKHGRNLNEDIWLASGSYVLILNHCRPENENSLALLCACCEQDNISAAGGMILDRNRLIAHSELIVGVKDGIADPFKGMNETGPGYLNKAVVAGECSAVIPGAVIFRKKDWNRSGRFDEAYESELFFVDYCLRLRQQGRKVVYYPYSKWIMDADTKVMNMNDMSLFRNTWKDTLSHCDPYYNPNFDPESGLYQI